MRIPPKLRVALLIIGLAGTLAAVKWADSLPDVGDASAGAIADRARDRNSRPQQSSAQPSSSALDLQRLQRGPQHEPESDPFGARDFRPPPPPKPKPMPGQLDAALAMPPPPPPQAPPLPFIYLGRLNEDQGTTVFLTAGDRNLVVKPGDVIDNTYKIEQVTDSAVVLTYLPMNQQQTLAIGTP
jgi:hypothetical protein